MNYKMAHGHAVKRLCYYSAIPNFSAHRISNPNDNVKPSPDCSHLLLRDAVGRKVKRESPYSATVLF